MEKILVVDDEKHIRDLIKFNLDKAGFQVLTAADGKEALKILNNNIDLIVLDLMLPEIDGLEVCRKMRADDKLKNIPIIMLTAKGEEVDRILGLEMGADDYMTKPFSPRELTARIKAIFRRMQVLKNDNNSEDEIIKRGNIELNIQSHEVRKNEELLELTPKEFQLLKFLM